MSESAPLDWRLRSAFADLWGQDAAFQRSLAGLYRTHCRGAMPPAMAQLRRDTARETLVQAYGDRAGPRYRPRFADVSLQELVELGAEDPESGPWALSYLAAVRRLATRSGLARWMPADPPGRLFAYGEQLIHEWCVNRAASAPGAFRPAHFAAVVVGGVYFRPPIEAPSIDVRWDPRDESYDAARARLRREVDARLAIIRAAWEASPDELRTGPPNMARDLRWVFDRVRHGRSLDAIASHAAVADDHIAESPDPVAIVQRATVRMADRLDVRMT